MHQDGLSFYIHTQNQLIDTIDKSFKFKANPIELLTAIQESYAIESSLQQEFEKVTILYHHDIFTTVPSQIFQEDHASDYLKYNTRILQTDTISIDKSIGNTGAHIVYVAYSNISNYFYEKYGDHSYYHYSSKTIPVLQQLGDGLYINVQASNFYLTVLENGKLKAHNLFEYQEREDILYYTMFAIQQHDLDPENVRLTLLSNKIDQELNDLLYLYVRNVHHKTDYQEFIKKVVCA
jgi:hypothetical protein